ncbi:hypothetical protein [Halorubellus litoreus]|uniref:Uncharacterized protein n=1 Tax=Halorubellus litoreus TaxID=755308 RepID=A0ABD5VJA9_9EURY
MSFEYPFHDRHGFPLPQASTETDARVQVSPGLNALSVPPRVQDVLGNTVGVLQFPVVFAGYRSRTAAGAAFRVHKRDLCRTARAVVDGDEPLDSGARRLVGHDRALTDLQAGFSTVTRAGLHAFLSWLVEDEAYVDWYVDSYAENDSFAEPDALRDAIETLGRGAGRGGAVATLAGEYRDVLDRHGLGAFETAIDVALDPPLSTTGLEHPPADGRRASHDREGPGAPRVLSTHDLEARAHRVLDAVADLDTETGADRALAAFHTGLREAIGDPADGGLAPATAAGSWATQTAVADLPLLAEPHRARPDDRTARDHQDSVGYPTGQAWLFAQAYEAAGFGAVLYQRRGGDPNWLVSPYVASDAVHGGESYAAVWERAFVTDRLTARLLDRAADIGRGNERLTCPLCALSTDRCGGDDCAFADQLAAFRDRAPALVDAVQTVGR